MHKSETCTQNVRFNLLPNLFFPLPKCNDLFKLVFAVVFPLFTHAKETTALPERKLYTLVYRNKTKINFLIKENPKEDLSAKGSTSFKNEPVLLKLSLR